MEQYESQQYRGCTINIGFDGDSDSPREWDNVATFVCKHPHYSLGDKQNVKGVVEDLFSDHVTDKAIIDFFVKSRNAEYIPGEEEDDSDHYYKFTESHAINMMNLNLELNDEDIKNIDGFVNNLNKKYPDGFDIKWDEPSIGSPYFDSKPEFGLACDCVTLRIYKK